MAAVLVEEAVGPRTWLGESPRWDGVAWWWVDASVGDVWTRTLGEDAVCVWRTGRRTSLVQPEASGGVVVAVGQELYVLGRRDDGAWGQGRRWCGLGLGDGWLVNDGVADSRGRLWIGSIAPDRRPLDGGLLRVEPDGTVGQAASGFTLTNGMAFSADEQYLFHVDTFERAIWAHRVDLDIGEVFGREAFVDFTADDGMPDGLAIDADGGVWVAMYGSGEARRYTPTGSLDFVVVVDPAQCTSIALGGPDSRDVLITTAREGYGEERSTAEPLAGRLYQARSPYPGLATATVAVQKDVAVEKKRRM
ncbi:SMP-30/gluconolactonase/LRE family protein [Phytoactinopolyspora alkaliphila]|uniref:SMP-30/gluconolactonase/LRE family protein n=1 Tax=Phytoactinopolyspora alkaliphila TaxID=1783498 RepID=A0A6N9YST3_9ACTN|nr:SMP-30/gluconolactonase/LRE family protein [Phytoactinopolyspora alkaliphila]